jgi:hypothetical protein
MDCYIGTKIVKAEPMTALDFMAESGKSVTAKHPTEPATRSCTRTATRRGRRARRSSGACRRVTPQEAAMVREGAF